MPYGTIITSTVLHRKLAIPARFQSRTAHMQRITVTTRLHERPGHFCLTLTVCHSVSSDCLSACGCQHVMPRAYCHITGLAHTVSARWQALPTLRIPLCNLEGFPEQCHSPSSVAERGPLIEGAVHEQRIPKGRIDHWPRAFCYLSPVASGRDISARLCIFSIDADRPVSRSAAGYSQCLE